MEAVSREVPGSGGGLRYLSEVATSRIVNQGLKHSCQCACARQLLIDAGVDLTEQDLLARFGYIEGYGTISERTAEVLSDLHPFREYHGGSVAPEAIDILLKHEPWIASLRTDRGTIHAVIVDGIDGDIIQVRDPWGLNGPGSGTGSLATIKYGDFIEHWHWALNNIVFPQRRSKEVK